MMFFNIKIKEVIMALGSCSECGHNMASSATSCQNCGSTKRPVRTRYKKIPAHVTTCTRCGGSGVLYAISYKFKFRDDIWNWREGSSRHYISGDELDYVKEQIINCKIQECAWGGAVRKVKDISVKSSKCYQCNGAGKYMVPEWTAYNGVEEI